MSAKRLALDELGRRMGSQAKRLTGSPISSPDHRRSLEGRERSRGNSSFLFAICRPIQRRDGPTDELNGPLDEHMSLFCQFRPGL